VWPTNLAIMGFGMLVDIDIVVEVYVDCLALSFSSDSWLRWLVHEA
jgi:hypothetical protein